MRSKRMLAGTPCVAHSSRAIALASAGGERREGEVEVRATLREGVRLVSDVEVEAAEEVSARDTVGIAGLYHLLDAIVRA